MVNVDEFDAVNTEHGSVLEVLDEEEGHVFDTSNDSTTSSSSHGEVGCECKSTEQTPPSNCVTNAAYGTEVSNLGKGIEVDSDAPSLDTDIERLFQRARQMRHFRYKARPFGMLGLYQHLCDIREDYKWARVAVRRRQQGQPYMAWIDHQHLILPRNQSHARTLHWFGCIMFVASTALLVASFAMNNWQVESMSVNSMVGPSAAVLLRLGALQRSSIVTGRQWYRIVTAIPLHAGVIHWLLNGAAMLWMSRSCMRPDTWLDSRRFIAVFVVAAVAGNLCSASYSPFTVSMGASGGMFGWLGCCFADVVANFDIVSRSDDGYIFPRRTAIAWLVVEVILLVGLGMTPYVDNFAHMGGFLTGIGIEWTFKSGVDRPGRLASSARRDEDARPMAAPHRRLRQGWTLILVVLLIMFHVGLLVRSTSNQDVCKKCRYLSCVPFPFWTTHKWWRCDSCEYCSVQTTWDGVGSGKEWLDITCPYGDVVRRPYPRQQTRDAILNTMVPQACRESCSL